MKLIDGVTAVVSKIVERDGHVKPSALVDAARPEESPAHGAFEWDDGKAAEEYRLGQARSWIRDVRLIVEEREERLIHIPSITRSEPEGCYKPISVVVNNVDEYGLALAEMSRKLQSAKSSYDDLLDAAKKTNKPIDNGKVIAGFMMIDEALKNEMFEVAEEVA